MQLCSYELNLGAFIMNHTYQTQSVQPSKRSCESRRVSRRQSVKRLAASLATLLTLATSSSAFATGCFKDGNWRDAVGSKLEVTIKVKAADASDGWVAYKRSYVIGNRESNPEWDKENPDKAKTVSGSYTRLFDQTNLTVKAGKLKKNIFETWFVKDNLRLYCQIPVGTAGVGYDGLALDVMTAAAIRCEKNPGKTYNGKAITDETFFTCDRNFKKKDNKFVFQFVLKDR